MLYTAGGSGTLVAIMRGIHVIIRRLGLALIGAYVGVTLSGCASAFGPMPRAPKVDVQRPTPDLSAPFAWGFASSSYQYEDPAVVKGDKDYFSTDWDIETALGKAPEKGNALYSWTHFEKDLAALKKIGATHYRFSIEWARVEPKPGVYNEAAIRKYASMARRLKEAGIEPIVCLWHFTFPDWLYDRKNPSASNWLHPMARERWNAYVARMVEATAPYTNYYAPQNEPNGQITTAYIVGQWPPSMVMAFGHYWKAIDASAAMFRDAAKLVKSVKPSAKIVSVEAMPWWERAPIDVTGYLQRSMIHTNFDHLDRVADVCDILGINYYYSQKVGPLAYLSIPYRRGHNFTMMGWRINPEGLYDQIRAVGDRYKKPMMITENGIATKDDTQRISYITDHLAAVGRAIRDGYDVCGYFAWSLADNYEWHYGYEAKFGLATMDPKTLTRVFKPSADFYRNTIRSHRTVGSVRSIKPFKSTPAPSTR